MPGKESDRDLRSELAEANDILTYIGNVLERVTADLGREYSSPPESFQSLDGDVERLMNIVTEVTLRIEALDPRAQTWHLRLLCADGIMYENDLLDTVVVPFELAGMLASGRRLAITVEDIGHALVFVLPQGRKAVPKSLVALLAEDTYVEAAADARGTAKAEGGA